MQNQTPTTSLIANLNAGNGADSAPQGARSMQELQNRFFYLPLPKQTQEQLQHRAEMRIHTRGENPGSVLLRRHLTEDEDCHRWRLDNYVAITRPAMQRALAQLARLFVQGNYGIEASAALEKYLSGHNFAGSEFGGFVQQRLLPAVIEDPNGWLIWLPDGPGRTDASLPVSPRPLIVNTEQIHYRDAENLIYLSEDKSMIDRGSGPVPEGAVYHWLTPDTVYRYIQEGRSHERRFRLEVWYRHELGSWPALQLGGIAVSDGWFESFFARFLPFAHEAIRQFSDWQVITSAHAYPVKEIRVLECDQHGCHEGLVNGSTCPKCHGKGYVFKTGPFSALIRPEANAALGEADSDAPMMRYITPPTDILLYAQQAWETLLERAEEAISLHHSREPQSGIAKAYDRDEQYILLEQMGRHVYEHLIGGSLWIMERLLQPFAPQRPRVIRPSSFRPDQQEQQRLRWQTEALQGPLRGASLPVMKAWADSQFPPHSKDRRFVQLLASLDPLGLYTLAEQLEMMQQGVLSAEEVRQSVLLPHRLEELARLRGEDWLLAADTATILAQLEFEFYSL